MRVLILGGDGLVGAADRPRFSATGHDVGIVDCGIRRRNDAELGTASLVPIASLTERVGAGRATTGKRSRGTPTTSPTQRSSRRRCGDSNPTPSSTSATSAQRLTP